MTTVDDWSYPRIFTTTINLANVDLRPVVYRREGHRVVLSLFPVLPPGECRSEALAELVLRERDAFNVGYQIECLLRRATGLGWPEFRLGVLEEERERQEAVRLTLPVPAPHKAKPRDQRGWLPKEQREARKAMLSHVMAARNGRTGWKGPDDEREAPREPLNGLV